MIHDVAKLVEKSKVDSTIRKDLITEIDFILLIFWLLDAYNEETDTFNGFDLIKVYFFKT